MSLFAAILALSTAFAITPDFQPPQPDLTPGVLCDPSDPAFRGYDYPEHVARCNREVDTTEKREIAAEYGNIPQANWPDYEFDHFYPLCAGGSNNIHNLWPQILDEAHKKDVVENDVCLAMKAGTMTQVQAMQKIRDWFTSSLLQPQQVDPLLQGQAVCKNRSGVVVHFQVLGNNAIRNPVLALQQLQVEHEAVHVDGVVNGRPVGRLKTSLFSGFQRYVLNAPHEVDEFTIYLPNQLTRSDKVFAGYLKVRFEENYPQLTVLDCSQP